MRTLLLVCFACQIVFTSVYLACTNNEPPSLVLPAEYMQIKSIEAEAQCRGPKGAYTTSVLSFTGGTCSFSQKYSYKNTPYRAQIRPDYLGLSIDSSGKILDTLSAEAVEMIRSHDFQRMFARPQDLFQAISFQKKVDAHTQVFQAKNRLNAPVELFFDNKEKRISRVDLLNPADSTQAIEIVPTQWMDTGVGKLVSALYIVQGGKDTFDFEYKILKINQKE